MPILITSRNGLAWQCRGQTLDRGITSQNRCLSSFHAALDHKVSLEQLHVLQASGHGS
jgi:hypothetical protein